MLHSIVTSSLVLSTPENTDLVFCNTLSPAFVPSASVPSKIISSPASEDPSVLSNSKASPPLLAKVPDVLSLFKTNVATSC